jgi:uncharacterized MAPEG superfamily protein
MIAMASRAGRTLSSQRRCRYRSPDERSEIRGLRVEKSPDFAALIRATGKIMTIAEYCIFASVMLYLLTIAPIKWLGIRSFDNAKPRDPHFYDDALRGRAWGAHQNGIESFPFFAAAVLLAEFRNAPQNLIDELALLFVIVRVAYVFTYLGDRPTLRSILWAIGFTINAAIFFLPVLRSV